MTVDALVIGGGLSGLGAAVELARRGAKVTLLERREFLGGRTYSFVDQTTGDVVDNGQHLMMGCYHTTRRFLKTIGTDHLATLQRTLQIDFLHPGIGRASLRCPTLPPPFHILAGLLGLKTLPFVHRLKLLRVGHRLFTLPKAREAYLDSISVDEWLRRLGQPAENRKYLWDVIAVGSLNGDPREVSALMFFRVLKAAFMGTREDSAMLLPRVGLTELFVDPAVKFIETHGGNVRRTVGVKRLLGTKDRIEGVDLINGGRLNAGKYILAIPYFDLVRLMGESPAINLVDFHTASQFRSSSIITINLWLDRTVFQHEFAAVLDSRIQWIFNKTRLLRLNQEDLDGRQYLSIVISGADEHAGVEKERLVTMALEDLRWVLPAAREAQLLHARVINEKRATFSPLPGMNAFRPTARTSAGNLLLAGDWTDTGLPATIEGALLSGEAAARLACE